jgi:hypothetical protein
VGGTTILVLIVIQHFSFSNWHFLSPGNLIVHCFISNQHFVVNYLFGLKPGSVIKVLHKVFIFLKLTFSNGYLLF